MADDRPTDAEKADAVMRLLDQIEAAHSRLNAAGKVLGERKVRGQGGFTGPLFPYVGESAYRQIEIARKALWDLEKVVAPQFLSATRAVNDARG